MEIIGTIKQISETQVVSERFKKRDFVLITEEETPYPQFVSFQMVQDKVNTLDAVKVGYKLKVQFNIKGREWTSPQGEVKYFNTLDAWRFDIIEATFSETNNQQSSSSSNTIQQPFADDDLPF